jgi:aryl-alcohol dehydrogenase-like predicted oxidoreductase
MPPLPRSPLGRSGLEVSAVGLGCNNFGRRLDLAGSRAVIDAALDAGITFLDTADVYGDGASERFIGEALAGRRDRVVLATKFGLGPADGPGGSPANVRRAVTASLARLRTEWVDVLYYHRPDGVTPLHETVSALAELIDEGLVRAFGVSNVDAGQLDEAARAGGDRLAAVQNEYNLLARGAEADVLPRAHELGVGFVPYFPLASGLLSGKFRRGEPPPPGTRMAGRFAEVDGSTFDRMELLESFAARRGRTLLELAIAGLTSRPGVASVIAGAMTADQVAGNAAAAAWGLTPAELDELGRL